MSGTCNITHGAFMIERRCLEATFSSWILIFSGQMKSIDKHHLNDWKLSNWYETIRSIFFPTVGGGHQSKHPITKTPHEPFYKNTPPLRQKHPTITPGVLLLPKHPMTNSFALRCVVNQLIGGCTIQMTKGGSDISTPDEDGDRCPLVIYTLHKKLVKVSHT